MTNALHRPGDLPLLLTIQLDYKQYGLQKQSPCVLLIPSLSLDVRCPSKANPLLRREVMVKVPTALKQL